MDIQTLKELEKRTLERLEKAYFEQNNEPTPTHFKAIHQAAVRSAIYAIDEYEKLKLAE